MAVTASTERQVEALVASCAAPGDSTELFDSVSRRLRRMVPFDGAAWFATDPVTTLATCPVRIENVEAGHCFIALFERDHGPLGYQNADADRMKHIPMPYPDIAT